MNRGMPSQMKSPGDLSAARAVRGFMRLARALQQHRHAPRPPALLPQHGGVRYNCLFDPGVGMGVVPGAGSQAKLQIAHSRLYRRRILQSNPSLKALAEIYTIRIFLLISDVQVKVINI